MIEVSGTSSSCSSPDALGFDESEKGIFGSLRNIAQLPPSSPKEGDRVADSVAGDAGNLVVGEADKKSPTASAGECLWLRSTGFFIGLSLMSLYFQTSRARIGRRVPLLLLMSDCSRWVCHNRRWKNRSGSLPVLPRGFWAVILLSL